MFVCTAFRTELQTGRSASPPNRSAALASWRRSFFLGRHCAIVGGFDRPPLATRLSFTFLDVRGGSPNHALKVSCQVHALTRVQLQNFFQRVLRPVLYYNTSCTARASAFESAPFQRPSASFLTIFSPSEDSVLKGYIHADCVSLYGRATPL